LRLDTPVAGAAAFTNGDRAAGWGIAVIFFLVYGLLDSKRKIADRVVLSAITTMVVHT
jgi:hypothetical protein